MSPFLFILPIYTPLSFSSTGALTAPSIIMSKTFAPSDVSSHNKPDSLWIIVDQDVYDLTKFQEVSEPLQRIRVEGSDR